MGAVPDVPHLKFLPNRYLIYDIQEKFMDNIYVNYLLTALILTFAIPGAGVVIEHLFYIKQTDFYRSIPP